MKKSYEVSVNLQFCKMCGICVYICRKDVFEIKDGNIRVRNKDCIGCGLCELICPDLAIEVRKK